MSSEKIIVRTAQLRLLKQFDQLELAVGVRQIVQQHDVQRLNVRAQAVHGRIVNVAHGREANRANHKHHETINKPEGRVCLARTVRA